MTVTIRFIFAGCIIIALVSHQSDTSLRLPWRAVSTDYMFVCFGFFVVVVVVLFFCLLCVLLMHHRVTILRDVQRSFQPLGV